MHESKESEAETARPGGHEGRKEKIMKVKNVIRGLQREYALQEINIISQAESKVYYSGTMDGWKATDINLILLKREIEDSEVIDRIMFNNRKAFIFIPPIGAYYPT